LTVSANIALALGVFYILYATLVPLEYSIPWILTMLGISVFRLKLASNYLNNKDEKKLQLNTLSTRNYILLFGTSVFWSIAYIFIMHYGNESYDLIALMILIGYLGSSILSAASSWQMYLTLNLLSTITAYTFFQFQSHPVAPVESILISIAIIFIFGSARLYSKKLSNSFDNAYELDKSRTEVIRVLGRAGEYREENTGQHILRMSYSCYLLAKSFGYSEKEAKQLQHASTLHDVGKICIPDDILLKPGKLNPDEIKIVREHAQIGHDILGETESETIKLAKSICLTHHEKWDGSGYPNHLKGEDIPIEGRIVAVCDVYDALTSTRPYRKAWHHDKALDYLQSHSGSHFDPVLVKHFVKVLHRVIKYKEQHQ